MNFTYFGSNTWLIDWFGFTILVDPWLVGDLSFGIDWLFRGKLRNPLPIPAHIDLILLSQGLADHAHKPTLEQLDRSIPVVGSPTAAKVVQDLGYTQVIRLKPGEAHAFDDRLEIRAVSGAPVPQVENGYVLTHGPSQQRAYYEPHGFFGPELKTLGTIDVVITPVVNLELPLAGPIIKGQTAAPALAKLLKPRTILATATGGDVAFQGLLMAGLQAKGTIVSTQAQIHELPSTTEIIALDPGATFSNPL